MKTIELQGTVTALSSIIHNGGESFGISSMLRREKFVQPNGDVESIPILSGNGIRGILRDRGMFHMLSCLGYGIDEEKGEVKGLPLPAFYFLFSGGSLVSGGGDGIDVDWARKIKDTIPLVSLFGGAVGNMIMPGKMKIGKLIPIAEETNHLLPEKFQNDEAQSVWEYVQEEMYTRRDDEKNDRLRQMIAPEIRGLLGDAEQKHIVKSQATGGTAQQMLYRVESLVAGTKFYWKVILEDVTEVEFDAFITTMVQFSKAPYLGGKSAVGHGEVSIKMDKWVEIDSRANLQGKEVDAPVGKKYQQFLENESDNIRRLLHEFE